MNRRHKLLFVGVLIIALFDAFGSIVSREVNFNSAYLAPVTFLLYGTFGFILAKWYNTKTGVLTAAALGLFDSTIGWEISMLLKPNTGDIKNDPSLSTWVITIIFVTGLAALCGLIGAMLLKITTKKPLSNDLS
ncbi:hypothetical protein FFF34_011925 [Inquilinus sp. KBS0705]|nr:hypothetical protein FFF34_011925 [Inquilinus sp. KBS0705]